MEFQDVENEIFRNSKCYKKQQQQHWNSCLNIIKMQRKKITKLFQNKKNVMWNSLITSDVILRTLNVNIFPVAQVPILNTSYTAGFMKIIIVDAFMKTKDALKKVLNGNVKNKYLFLVEGSVWFYLFPRLHISKVGYHVKN